MEIPKKNFWEPDTCIEKNQNVCSGFGPPLYFHTFVNCLDGDALVIRFIEETTLLDVVQLKPHHHINLMTFQNLFQNQHATW